MTEEEKQKGGREGWREGGMERGREREREGGENYKNKGG